MEIVISGFKNFAFFQIVENRGGYKIFSKGGGAIYQNFLENFVDLFWLTKSIFGTLPEH